MPRRHKNKRSKVTIDNTSMMFYPLYSGWREDKIPIFRYASEALSWQISRYFKDAICHSWGDDSYPIWLSFVGGVQDDISLYNNIQRTYTSDVEKQYFKATKFFEVTSVDHDFPTLFFIAVKKCLLIVEVRSTVTRIIRVPQSLSTEVKLNVYR